MPNLDLSIMLWGKKQLCWQLLKTFQLRELSNNSRICKQGIGSPLEDVARVGQLIKHPRLDQSSVCRLTSADAWCAVAWLEAKPAATQPVWIGLLTSNVACVMC